jgi:hypothetical protein
MRNFAQGSRAINQSANKFSALLKNKVAGELPEQKDDIDLARQQVFELLLRSKGACRSNKRRQ